MTVINTQRILAFVEKFLMLITDTLLLLQIINYIRELVAKTVLVGRLMLSDRHTD
jgi:hypothetical protein